MSNTTVNQSENIISLKEQEEQKYDDLIKQCSMFFAFSNEQFAENKTPLQEGEKYVSIGGGAFMPKSKLELWQAGGKSITKWYKDATKETNIRKANIAYELANHEAYYTYDIDDTLDALGEGYTAVEVWAVFHAEKAKHTND